MGTHEYSNLVRMIYCNMSQCKALGRRAAGCTLYFSCQSQSLRKKGQDAETGVLADNQIRQLYWQPGNLKEFTRVAQFAELVAV